MNSLILYALIVLIWGSTWNVIKFQLDYLSLEASLFYRFGLASILVFGWAKWRGMGLRFSAYHHLKMAQSGLFLFCINYLFLYSASHYLTTGLISVIFSTTPILNTINGKLFLRKKLRRRIIIGSLLGLLGILTIFSQELTGIGLNDKALWGIGLAMIGTYAFSFGNILAHKTELLSIPVIPKTAFSMAYGALFLLIFTFISKRSITFEYSWRSILALGYLSLFGSVFAFVSYLTLLKRIGAECVAYVTILIPIIALTISTFVENYHWTIQGCAGIVLTLFGNVLVLRNQKMTLPTDAHQESAL